MATKISFTGERTRHFDLGGISFKANVDGKPLACRVSEEALQDHFGAVGGVTLEQAFDSNRDRIERIAESMIAAGRVEPDGKLLIRTADV